jgi:tRNA (cmo5U34)-methyltransferase
MHGEEWKAPEYATRWLARDGPMYFEPVVAPLLAKRLATSGCPERVLDLGTGSGRVLRHLRAALPSAELTGLDISPILLAEAARSFSDDPHLTLIEADMGAPLPAGLEPFDLVISSLAIHHLPHDRKRSLYGEVLSLLTIGGQFCIVDTVTVPSPEFLAELAQQGIFVSPDPSDQPATVEQQVMWLTQAGFMPVECVWRDSNTAVVTAARPRTMSQPGIRGDRDPTS